MSFVVVRWRWNRARDRPFLSLTYLLVCLILLGFIFSLSFLLRYAVCMNSFLLFDLVVSFSSATILFYSRLFISYYVHSHFYFHLIVYYISCCHHLPSNLIVLLVDALHLNVCSESKLLFPFEQHTHTKNRTYTEKNNNFNTECAPRARCKQHFRQMNQTTQLYTAEYKRNRNFNTTTRPYYFVFVFVVFMSCFVHVYIYECRYILNVLAFILFALVALLFHAFDPMALSENEFFMPIAVQWIKIARTWQLKIFAWNKMSYTPTSHLNKNKGTTPLSISPPFTYIEYMNCSLSVRFSSVGSHFFVFFILHLLLFLLWNM